MLGARRNRDARRHSSAGWAEKQGCQDSLDAPGGCWPHLRQSRSLHCTLAVLGCSLQSGWKERSCSSSCRKATGERRQQARNSSSSSGSSMLASCLATEAPTVLVATALKVAAAHQGQRSKQTCMGRKQMVAWSPHGRILGQAQGKHPACTSMQCQTLAEPRGATQTRSHGRSDGAAIGVLAAACDCQHG